MDSKLIWTKITVCTIIFITTSQKRKYNQADIGFHRHFPVLCGTDNPTTLDTVNETVNQ